MTMTQAKWNAMTPAQRNAARDLSGLSPQLVGLEGKRVEVRDMHGELRRFWVGRSTGWRPCHLEVKLRSSTGGGGASLQYASVRVVDQGPR